MDSIKDLSEDFTEAIFTEKSLISSLFLKEFHSFDDLYIKSVPGEGVRSSVSFLVERLNSEKRDIGVLNFRILRISIKQR